MITYTDNKKCNSVTPKGAEEHINKVEQWGVTLKSWVHPKKDPAGSSVMLVSVSETDKDGFYVDNFGLGYIMYVAGFYIYQWVDGCGTVWYTEDPKEAVDFTTSLIALAKA